MKLFKKFVATLLIMSMVFSCMCVGVLADSYDPYEIEKQDCVYYKTMFVGDVFNYNGPRSYDLTGKTGVLAAKKLGTSSFSFTAKKEGYVVLNLYSNSNKTNCFETYLITVTTRKKLACNTATVSGWQGRTVGFKNRVTLDPSLLANVNFSCASKYATINYTTGVMKIKVASGNFYVYINAVDGFGNVLARWKVLVKVSPSNKPKKSSQID